MWLGKQELKKSLDSAGGGGGFETLRACASIGLTAGTVKADDLEGTFSAVILGGTVETYVLEA